MTVLHLEHHLVALAVVELIEQGRLRVDVVLHHLGLRFDVHRAPVVGTAVAVVVHNFAHLQLVSIERSVRVHRPAQLEAFAALAERLADELWLRWATGDWIREQRRN